MKVSGPLFLAGMLAVPRCSRGFTTNNGLIRSTISRNGAGYGMFKNLFGATAGTSQYPIYGEEEIMSQKEHGTSSKPVQDNLRWSCDFETADRIVNFNRHYAEFAGSWEVKYSFLQELDKSKPVEFFDSVTGDLLFTAPVGRTWDEWIKESRAHGWPSFRDDEVNWENVRVLKDGECVSVTGGHLGHNLPDGSGNRYCINLVSVAGKKEVDN